VELLPSSEASDDRLGQLCESEGYMPLRFFSLYDHSVLPIRWSVVVPAYFINKHLDAMGKKRPQWVLLAPPLNVSNAKGRTTMRTAGKHLLTWIARGSERVCVVVSGDLSHHHSFKAELFEKEYLQSLDPAKCAKMNSETVLLADLATNYDEAIRQWALTQDEQALTRAWQQNARLQTACGFLGFEFLHGLLAGVKWELAEVLPGETTVYAHPTYYGMLVVHWHILGLL
jgi:aromatic ring-opening dioxygenase LigB subunit